MLPLTDCVRIWLRAKTALAIAHGSPHETTGPPTLHLTSKTFPVRVINSSQHCFCPCVTSPDTLTSQGFYLLIYKMGLQSCLSTPSPVCEISPEQHSGPHPCSDASPCWPGSNMCTNPQRLEQDGALRASQAPIKPGYWTKSPRTSWENTRDFK